MSPDLIQRLIDTGYCWSMSYYQSLSLDAESDACGMSPPKDQWQVVVIAGEEDQVEGWGSTPDEAARAALAQFQ